MNDPLSQQVGWMLLAVGILLVVAGAVVLFGPSVGWLGRLPGDIRIERENVRIYIPLATCLVISLVLSAALWLVRVLTR